MKVMFYGTRGSCPVSEPNKNRYGGNTTCLRIESDRLPSGMWLVIDAGTGIVPLSKDFVAAGGKRVELLFTHYHHDHTQGLLLSALPFLNHVPISMWGPVEHEKGPREVYEELMTSPHFPVEFREVAGHIESQNIEHPNVTLLAIHSEGGVTRFFREDFDRLMAGTKQIPFGERLFGVDECMIIRMHKSHHPEQTISYRIEERSSNQVFVFLTDNENRDGVSRGMWDHLHGANFLAIDCQYTREKYDTMTAGWGHGTPDHVVKLAIGASVEALGLTHHDPASDDKTIDAILETARTEARKVKRGVLDRKSVV